MTPLTGHLVKLIAVLPAVHAMIRGGLLLILSTRVSRLRGSGLKHSLEGVQDLGDVIVELDARERGCGGQSWIFLDGPTPDLQNDRAPFSEVRGQCIQLLGGFLRGVRH